MGTSKLYDQLKTRIQQIEAHLLPTIDPTIGPTDKDSDLTRSYCLLCHAEFEAYLEDIVLETIRREFSNWSADKSIITPIIFHIALNCKEKIAPYSMVVKSFQDLEKKITKNHGIKKDNLNLFFNYIGFEIDSLLADSLETYGSKRGVIAHTSFHTQQPLDPSVEKAAVQQIMGGLSILDVDLQTYEADGRAKSKPANIKWKLSFIDRVKILFTGNC